MEKQRRMQTEGEMEGVQEQRCLFKSKYRSTYECMLKIRKKVDQGGEWSSANYVFLHSRQI